MRNALDAAPLDRYRRARKAILLACPKFAEDWACEYVAWLVGDGEVPESSLAKALERFRKRVALGKSGDLPEICVESGYLGVILRRMVTSEYNLPWENRGRGRKTG